MDSPPPSVGDSGQGALGASPAYHATCLYVDLGGRGSGTVRDALGKVCLELGIELRTTTGSSSRRRIVDEMRQADAVVAFVNEETPEGYQRVEAATALRKRTVVVYGERSGRPPAFVGVTYLAFRDSPTGRVSLLASLRELLLPLVGALSPDESQLVEDPLLSREFVDFDRLDARTLDNLCFELLRQMGFKDVAWLKETPFLDVFGTLPRTDPDGWRFDEPWVVSTGARSSAARLLRLPGSFFEDLFLAAAGRANQRLAPSMTLLLINAREGFDSRIRSRIRQFNSRIGSETSAVSIRARVWDGTTLRNLLERYPALAFKYFSAEAGLYSGARKSADQLYQENVQLTERLQLTVADLHEERDRRQSAERDAIWKDLSFTAAHKLGNPIFALETGLQGLRKRLDEGRDTDAREVVNEMGNSIEKAKLIVEQFKLLTRAQDLSLQPSPLEPLVSRSCHVAREKGVSVSIDVAPETVVFVDPERLAECFDELVANALHWVDSDNAKIDIHVGGASEESLDELDPHLEFTILRFSDNGCGVPADEKVRIFAPFFTTWEHGTGLGLSVVKRILEGHGGTIREVGVPGEGATFEMFLPLVQSEE